MSHPRHKLTMSARDLKKEIDAGQSAASLAEKYGVQKPAIYRKLSNAGMPASHKETCKPAKTRRPVERVEVEQQAVMRPRDDVMTWITFAGAVVTLPRVRFLEGRG